MTPEASYPTDVPPDDALISRYLAGECSAQKRAEIATWVSGNPEQGLVVEMLRARLAQPWPVFREGRGSELTRVRERLDQRLARLDRSRSPGQHSFLIRRVQIASGRRWMHLAIGLCCLTVLGIGTWTAFAPKGDVKQTTTMVATPGQRSTVRLADGSTMILAPASSATLTEQGIMVRGEAYFTIESRSDRPFTVRTDNAIVQVLGTRFSVRQYPGDKSSRVVVEDGRVMLHALQSHRDPETRPATNAVLSSKMLAIVTDSGITVTNGIATQDYTSWTRGMLVFESVALGDVVAELSRAYGADIRIVDTALAKQKMIMEVSVTEDSLVQVLTRICKASNAHFRRGGQTYFLSSGRGPRQAPPRMQQRHQILQLEQQYGR